MAYGPAWFPAGGLTVFVIVGAVLLADALKPWPRRAWLLAIGLALGFIAFEGVRFDHGYGRELAAGAVIVAPLLLIFGGAAWAARRLYGWPNLGDGLPRAAWLGLFIVVGFMLGTRRHEADIEATERLADAVAFDPARAAGSLPSTRLGLLAPPALRRGRDTGGELVVAFPLSGRDDGAWRYRRASSGAWATSDGRPPGVLFDGEAP